MSLAVLGLIAGLTVPSIVASVERSKIKNLIKEGYQAVATMVQNGYLNGDFNNITGWNIATQKSSGSIVAYITTQLNYTKQCFTGDVTSIGCNASQTGWPATGSTNNHHARWILANGVEIKAHDPSWFNQTNLGFDIWAKAQDSSGVMVRSGGQLTATSTFCNITDQAIPFWGNPSTMIKPGTCSIPSVF